MVWLAVSVALILTLTFVAFCKIYGKYVARLDTRIRLAVALKYIDDNPRPPDESPAEIKEEYFRRLHWHVLNYCGLPPPSIVNIWLNGDEFYIIAPIDMILHYVKDRFTIDCQTLPSGKAETQILNGNYKLIIELLESDESGRSYNTWDRVSDILDRRHSR